MKSKRQLEQISTAGLELVAERFRALGESNRLRLMLELSAGEKRVNDLVQATGLSQTNVSRHLQTLAAVGLLSRRKAGLNVYYKVSEPSIYEFCTVMCGGLRKHLEQQAKSVAH